VVPLAQRKFMLTPFDLMLTMDLALVWLTVAVGLDLYLSDGGNTAGAVISAAPVIFLFAGWLGKRHKVAPPPPSDNLFRRGLGLLLLAVGGVVSLVGVVIAVGFTYGVLTQKNGDVPWFAAPLSFIPLFLGHAVMYGGAKVRAGRSHHYPPSE